MNITDFLPIEELREITGLDIRIISIIIFIVGYITLKVAVKKDVIKIDDVVDKLFLIAVFGMVWFSRGFILCAFLIYSAQYFSEDILILITAFLIMVLTTSIADACIIFNKIARKNFMQLIRGILYSNNKVEQFYISWNIFSTIIVADIIYSAIANQIHGFSVEFIILMIMLISAFIPLIGWIIGLYQKIS